MFHKSQFCFLYHFFFIHPYIDPPRPPTLEVVGVTSSSVTLKWRKDPGDISTATGMSCLKINTNQKTSDIFSHFLASMKMSVIFPFFFLSFFSYSKIHRQTVYPLVGKDNCHPPLFYDRYFAVVFFFFFSKMYHPQKCVPYMNGFRNVYMFQDIL